MYPPHNYAMSVSVPRSAGVEWLFKHISLQTMKDWKLMIMISFFVCYGLILLVLRLVVPQFRVEPFLSINRENPSGLNVC